MNAPTRKPVAAAKAAPKTAPQKPAANPEMAMPLAVFTIQGLSPYSQSKALDIEAIPKNGRETPDAYEKRVWREKGHWNDDGLLTIPGISLKFSLIGAVRKFGHQVKGRKTFTSYFEGGLLPPDNPVIYGPNGETYTRETIEGQRLHVDANGKPGGTRVWRIFPTIPDGWTASFEMRVMDRTIVEDIFWKVLGEAGMFVGLGRWRPERGGSNGRFMPIKQEWR